MEKDKTEELVQHYIKKGNTIILPEKQEKWATYINNVRDNMVNLHEVAIAIEVIGMIEYGIDMNFVIRYFDKIECPVNKANIRSLVANYAIRGPEFFEKTSPEPLTEEAIIKLEQIKQLNARLIFEHRVKGEGIEYHFDEELTLKRENK